MTSKLIVRLCRGNPKNEVFPLAIAGRASLQHSSFENIAANTRAITRS
jgi:hypothetical protein